MKLKVCSCLQCKAGRKTKHERALIKSLKHSHRTAVRNLLKKIALTEDETLADDITPNVDIPYNG